MIIKNNVLGQIKWEQMVFLGNPEFGVQLQPIDFAEFAHACGGVGFTLENPEACSEVMEQFLAAPGPAILQAEVDQLEPPLPGKITAEQALHFAESLARGEPNRGKIALIGGVRKSARDDLMTLAATILPSESAEYN